MMSRELRQYEPTNPYGVAPGSPVQTIDMRRMMVALRRQKLTIVAPALLMGALGLVYVKSQPDTYDAYSNLLLASSQNTSVRMVGGIETALTSDLLENARVLLTSDKLAYDVLDRTGLEGDPRFLDTPSSPVSDAIAKVTGVLSGPANWLRAQINTLTAPAETIQPRELPDGVAPGPVGTDVEGARPVDPARQRAAAKLVGSVQVSRLAKSTAVAIRVTTFDPVISTEIANAYADAYVQDILTSNSESVGRTTDWMQTRLNELQTQARDAASEAERFATENGLVASSSGALLSEQSLAEVNASLSTAVSDAARAKAVLDTYDRAIAGGVEGLTEGSALSIGDEMSDSLIARLDNYNNVRARLQGLIQSGGPNHPQVAGLRQTLASTAERLFVELQAQRQDAQSKLQVANARVEALQGSVDDATARNTDQAANLVRLRALQERAATLSTLYQTTLTRSQEIEQQQSFPESNVRILSYAQVPPEPAGPNTMRAVLASTLLGLFLGCGIAGWRESRERFLRTADDVTEYAGLRFLGHLPLLPRSAGPRALTDVAPVRPVAASSGPTTGETLPALTRPQVPLMQARIPALMYPDSVYAETLRNVRLAATTQDRAQRITGVTSFHPYPGRAAVSLNLAAQMGLGLGPVLLIDADGRGRALSRMLKLDRRAGLSEVAAGRGHWHDMLVGIADTNITVLPCGKGRGGTSDDLLTGDLLRALLAEARQGFSAVVVDVPPLYPVVLGRAILQELPQFLAVGEWGRTPRSMAETTLADEPELHEKCIGVVYDRVNLRQLRTFLVPEAMENYLSRSKEYLSGRAKRDSSV